MAGFDDVIDYTRAAPEEVIARAKALVRRYIMCADSVASMETREANLAHLADVPSLSFRERRALEALAERRGRPVSREFLCEQVSRDVVGVSALYLRVVICGLRKKLRKDVVITCRTGQGYELSVNSRLPS